MKALKILLATALLLTAPMLAGCNDTPAAEQPGGRKVYVTMVAEKVLPGIGDGVKVGDQLRVKNTGTVVGEIVAVDVSPHMQAVPTAEGTLKADAAPTLVDVWLTIEGTAVVSESGYSFSGEYLYINSMQRYLTPTVSLEGIITSLEVAGD